MGPKSAGLPNKPSDLIKLALRDLELVEADKRYSVQMGTWHTPFDADGKLAASCPAPWVGRVQAVPGKCAVCLAGAVMAMTLDADREAISEPEDFDTDTFNALSALDAFRCGSLREGALEMGRSVELFDGEDARLPAFVEIVEYAKDAELFKRELRYFAERLREFGL